MGPLGILGGGQLGRMTLQAASAFGLDVVIAERFSDSPAARLTSQSVLFENGWDDAAALDRLAELATVVTLENEFVDWRVLESLEARGVRVLPSPACVGVVQDKLLQKQALARAELPVPLFCEVAGPAGLIAAAQELGWPLMLKARRDGYDGRGNVVVRAASEAEAAVAKLGSPGRALFAEALVHSDPRLAPPAAGGGSSSSAATPPRLPRTTCPQPWPTVTHSFRCMEKPQTGPAARWATSPPSPLRLPMHWREGVRPPHASPYEPASWHRHWL